MRDRPVIHIAHRGRMSAATMAAILAVAAAAAPAAVSAEIPPHRDFDRFPWLELVGKGRVERERLIPRIRDRAMAPNNRAARRRLEREQRKGR